jgi:O-antigen ligase
MLADEQQKQIFELGHTYFADIVLIHPLYLSTYFIFIFFFLLETLRTKRDVLNTLSKVGVTIALIFIVGMLLFLRSQMSLITFVMLLVMYAIIILKRRAWLVTFVLFTIALLVFLLDQNRVTTFFDTYGKNVSTALDQRFSVWRGAIEGIKTAPFFGAGTGGEQELINEGYSKTGYQEGIDNSYNAHNQYLQFMARNGILELGCFLALLIYSFRQSLKMTNYTFLMLNMSVTLIMFTESFLDVQRGIVFFYFFLCAFIYLPYESTSLTVKDV